MDTVTLSAVRTVLTAEIIGEAVHTSLRKMCDGGLEAHRAIAAMPQGEWHRAMDAVARDLVRHIEIESSDA